MKYSFNFSLKFNWANCSGSLADQSSVNRLLDSWLSWIEQNAIADKETQSSPITHNTKNHCNRIVDRKWIIKKLFLYCTVQFVRALSFSLPLFLSISFSLSFNFYFLHYFYFCALFITLIRLIKSYNKKKLSSVKWFSMCFYLVLYFVWCRFWVEFYCSCMSAVIEFACICVCSLFIGTLISLF